VSRLDLHIRCTAQLKDQLAERVTIEFRIRSRTITHARADDLNRDQ
jgi:hypothetical protein